MKKYIVLAVCLGMLLVSSMAMATDWTNTVPGAGISGTAHDFSLANQSTKYGAADATGYGSQKGTSLDRICVWCHTPHFSMKPNDPSSSDPAVLVNYLPLWNHTLSAYTYALYSNGTDQPTQGSHRSQAIDDIGGKVLPGSVSRLCLSCHDGSIGVNAYGNIISGRGDMASSNGQNHEPMLADKVIDVMYKIGDSDTGSVGDLSNHHPIGFTYPTTSQDNEIKDKTTAVGTTGQTIGDLLWAGKMECTSCHDVHNSRNEGEKFLYVSDLQSKFCLTCHDK